MVALAVCIIFAILILHFLFQSNTESYSIPLAVETELASVPEEPEEKEVNYSIPLAADVTFVSKGEEVNYSIPLTAPLASVPETKEVNYSLPVRLRIPSINVNTSVEHLGLTSKGAMAAPKGPKTVGWLKLSPHPGEVGSSVIDGHSGWKDGIPAVFDSLNKLKIGDKIYVEDKKGLTVTFVVREFRSYDPKADAKDVFNSSDGKSHLNLITCEGVWNPITKSRSKRLVVFADKE